MSGNTSVPAISFTDNGYVAPAESAVVTGLNADWTSAFGGNLNTAATEPVGQFTTSQGAVIGDSNNQQVALFNGVDPAYASGRMQDAIGRIYFMTRNPPLATILQVSCGGLPNVVIPVGALIQDTAQNLYSATGQVTIGAAGSVTAEFACTVTGPIAVPETNAVSIYQAIPNWNTVSVVSGTVGTNVETRAAFEARRGLSVAKNSTGPAAAILGNVLAVAGVLSAYVYSNNTANPVTVQGVTLAAYALYVAAIGGTAAAVAQAIFAARGPGPPFYAGNTTVTVYDTSPGYQPPYPAYSVTFEIPAGLTIWVAVSIKNSTSVPANASALISGAILAALAGTDGGPAATIGGTVYASRFYGGIAALGPWALIVSLLLGSANSPAAVIATSSISGTTLTVGSVSSGTVAIGQAVVGPGVADGTYITAGSGSSWTVGISQTVASTTMDLVVPTLNDVSVNIDQLPGATALDVVVALV